MTGTLIDPWQYGFMDEVLRLEREFKAPVARVYRAWTDPKILKRWAWGSLSNDVKADLDLKVGGTYRIETGGPEGQRWAFSGTYLEILPNERLEYSVQWDAPMGYESPDEKITVEFAGYGDTTRVVFVHDGLPEHARQEHEKGWRNTFDVLDTVLTKP